jgi:hypothetical protein
MKEWLTGSPAGMGIVCSVLPLASASGPAFIAVVIISAALFLWWLLRSDTHDEEAAKAEERTERES